MDTSIKTKMIALDSARSTGRIDDSQYYAHRAELTNKSGGGYVFDSEEAIINVIDSLATRAEDIDIFPVLRVDDPRRMMQLGLYPASLRMLPWVAHWLEGMELVDLKFWTVLDHSKTIRNLQDELVWEYRTLETLKREAISSANSIALKWLAPDLLYNDSQRPRTDMSLFRSALSQRINRKDVIDGKVIITGERWKVVPVTRYAQGMSRGLYHATDKPAYACGTFYYLEEESSAYLAYKTSLRAFNKTDACLKLGILDPEDENMEYILDDYDTLKKHIDGYYPRDMIMSPAEVYELSDLQFSVNPNRISSEPRYAGVRLGLYAGEDSFDQLLCREARDAGYDVVILENMIGAFQVVTEVLDTRTREDSFRSLLYIVD